MLSNWLIATIAVVGILSFVADWQDWFMGDKYDVT